MATFSYRGVDKRGSRQRGTISAQDGHQARQQLRQQGVRVQKIWERTAVTRTASTAKPGRQYRGDLTAAIRELSTLLLAGIPLLDSLESVLSQSRRGFRDAMSAVRDQVASGSSLADAMARDPAVFDEMTVGMIRVGESAGNLDEACEQVAEFRERSGELRDRVLSALLYPGIVLCVSAGVTMFLMTVVVPMLLTNLTEIGKPLPVPTLILKWLSDTLLGYGVWIAIGIALLSFAVICIARIPWGQQLIDRVSLRTPVLGTLIQKQSLSRMSLVVSSLLRSGVELVDALEIAERSSTNRPLKIALCEMRSDLSEGRDLRESTARHKIFTHSLAQVFSLGQQSGQLDKMLARLGNDYDRQCGLLANRLTTVLEPVLILALSVIVGFILFATVLPIMEAGNVLAE